MKLPGWLRCSARSAPTATEEPLWIQAERLRVLFKIESEEPALSFDQIMEMNLHTPSRYELLLLREIDLEAYGLFRAMQDVGYEFRARQYDALGRLAALVNAEPGATLDERFKAAIDQDVCAVWGYLDELGWLDGD